VRCRHYRIFWNSPEPARRRGIVSIVLLALLPAVAAAQSLEQRITQVGSGRVHLSYPARPGVCGNDRRFSGTPDDEWQATCEREPVRVSLEIRDHRVTRVRAHLGGKWKTSSAVDLGTVRPQEAAAYFLSLAEQVDGPGGDALLAAALADSAVIWPALLRVARSPRLPAETRRSAVFWLSQAAGKAVAPALDSIASDTRGDREIRKQAVFALSQREANESVPALIQIARVNPDPEIRRTALFWLGQSEDPRALALFEEILR
jgi:HEAT repeat protein